MWLCTKHGFYSIVQKFPSEWHVRARRKKDLENLVKLFPHKDTRPQVLKSYAGSDYPFRIILKEEGAVQFLMSKLAESIDYSNFKSEIFATPDQRAKLGAYHEVWQVMAAQAQEE